MQKLKTNDKVWLYSQGHNTYLPGKIVSIKNNQIATVSWQYGIKFVHVSQLPTTKPEGYA